MPRTNYFDAPLVSIPWTFLKKNSTLDLFLKKRFLHSTVNQEILHSELPLNLGKSLRSFTNASPKSKAIAHFIDILSHVTTMYDFKHNMVRYGNGTAVASLAYPV